MVLLFSAPRGIMPISFCFNASLSLGEIERQLPRCRENPYADQPGPWHPRSMMFI